MTKSQYYPSEEELSNRLPNFIVYNNQIYTLFFEYYYEKEKHNRYDFLIKDADIYFSNYKTEFSQDFLFKENDIPNCVTGKTTKECKQKTIILLNDMGLLK